jgi:lysozyme
LHLAPSGIIGNTATATALARRYPGEQIDPNTAERRLRSEVGNAAEIVNTHFPDLADGPRAALTSLTYNAGPKWINSGLGEAVRSGDMDTAQKLFLQYTKAGGAPNQGLADRRAQEVSWFNGGPLGYASGSPAGPPVQAADLPEDTTIPANAKTTLGQKMDDQEPSFLDRFAGGLQSPLVQFGLALASGKTPQEGLGNAANASFKLSQQSQLDQAKKAAYQAAIAAGATPQQAANLALNPEAFKALQPQFHTLTGLLGEQTPVFVNPFNQTITPVGGGQAPGGQEAVAQNGPNLPENYNEQGKDEAFLKALEDQYGTTVAKSVRDITEGRVPAMGRNLQKLIPLASRYDQNFTGAQDYQTRLQTAKSFAAGKDADAVKSINQAVTHANQVWDLIPKIEGVNVGGMAGKVINGPYGEIRAATDPEYANNRQRYNEIVNALSGELMKASRGSGAGTLEEIRNWKAGALSANSGAEMRGAIQGGMDFLHGAMDATAQKKAQGLKSQFEPTDLLSPQNQGIFARIRDYTEGGSRANAPANAGVQGARKAPDGNWYVPDPNRPGKYLRVVQ